MGEPRDFTVVELGAGRREMADAFSEWRYVPVDIDSGAMPATFRRRRFLQRILRRAAGGRRRVPGRRVPRAARRVARTAPSLAHRRSGAPPARSDYLRRYYPAARGGPLVRSEPRRARAGWSASPRALTKGYVLTIDYGFTRAESVRFPAGTLMGYRRHTAREDVLADPGERDITAHVNFTALEETRRSVRSRDRALRDAGADAAAAGEADQFAAALGARRRRRNCAAACSSRRCCSGWERRSGCCCRGKWKQGS